MTRWIAALCVTAALLSGCETNRECERARLDLSKTWRGLVEGSGRRQLAGVDIEGWKWVQSRTSLLESSFATTQITWDSAEKARKELVARLPSMQTDTPANLTGYQLSVESALKEQDAFAKKCK
jgi:hypothetical protein